MSFTAGLEICICLFIPGMKIDKRKVVRLLLMLNIIILPAWGIIQYGSEPVSHGTPAQTEAQNAIVEEQFRREALE